MTTAELRDEINRDVAEWPGRRNVVSSHHRFIDLTGKQFERLTVVAFSHRKEYAGSESVGMYWTCQCDCGNTVVVEGRHLRAGKIKSCGCLHNELLAARNRTHGMRRSPEYTTWHSMIGRCCNKNNRSFANYGGRGITVCDHWRNSFEAFYADMGPRPSPEHSIDRFPDSDGNYEPSNCRWATRKEQNRNKSTNRPMTFLGLTQSMAAWSEMLGISCGALKQRVHRGASDEDAIMRGGDVLIPTEDLSEWQREAPRTVLMLQYQKVALVNEEAARAALSGHGARPLSREWWSCSPNAAYRIVEGTNA